MSYLLVVMVVMPIPMLMMRMKVMKSWVQSANHECNPSTDLLNTLMAVRTYLSLTHPIGLLYLVCCGSGGNTDSDNACQLKVNVTTVTVFRVGC